jgi:glycine betaine/choline ABC-type transport system substrate-binding protein
MAEASNAVSARLTTSILTTLDTKIADGADPSTVAKQWVNQEGLG